MLLSGELARLLAVVERAEVWERQFPGMRERDRLLPGLFAFAGLRRAELLGLDWDDVDLERRLLRIRKAKGGRQRTVPIHPALEPLIADYLRLRACDPKPALFVGVHGRRLSVTILSVTLRRYAPAAGVTTRKRVTPHTLRHVFASELLRAGANLRQIKSCSATSTPTAPPPTRLQEVAGSTGVAPSIVASGIEIRT